MNSNQEKHKLSPFGKCLAILISGTVLACGPMQYSSILDNRIMSERPAIVREYKADLRALENKKANYFMDGESELLEYKLNDPSTEVGALNSKVEEYKREGVLDTIAKYDVIQSAKIKESRNYEYLVGLIMATTLIAFVVSVYKSK